LVTQFDDLHLPAHVEEQADDDRERDKNPAKTVTFASPEYNGTNVTCPGCHTKNSNLSRTAFATD
jgi:hypothetical protein